MQDDRSPTERPIRSRRVEQLGENERLATEARWTDLVNNDLPPDFDQEEGSEEVRFR